MSARIGGAAKRVAVFALLVICALVLLKIVVGAVVGFVKLLLVIGLLALFAFAVFAIGRR